MTGSYSCGNVWNEISDRNAVLYVDLIELVSVSQEYGASSVYWAFYRSGCVCWKKAILDRKWTNADKPPFHVQIHVINNGVDREWRMGYSRYSMTTQRMGVPYQATKIVVAPLQIWELEVFFVKGEALVERRYVSLLVLYCCDVFHAKGMSASDTILLCRDSLPRCMETGENIIIDEKSSGRSVTDIKIVNRHVWRFQGKIQGVGRMEMK